MQSEVSVRASFSEFVEDNEAGIRHALIGQLGSDVGRAAAAQALLYGLENWERVSAMENPVGYLFRVGQRWGRRSAPRRVQFAAVDSIQDLWFPEYQPMAPARRRRWSGPLIAGAVAAVVLALGLLTFITRATAPEIPALSGPSSASGWSRIPYDEALFGGAEMESVTVGGPGLVAVGGADDGAAVWTSPDGFTWSRVPDDEAVFGGAGMSSVTAGGPGLVAVGGDAVGVAVWTSVDGVTWFRVPPRGGGLSHTEA